MNRQFLDELMELLYITGVPIFSIVGAGASMFGNYSLSMLCWATLAGLAMYRVCFLQRKLNEGKKIPVDASEPPA